MYSGPVVLHRVPNAHLKQWNIQLQPFPQEIQK